jgi:predicted methyltransferase
MFRVIVVLVVVALVLGFTSFSYAWQAETQDQEKSVKPNINKDFLDPNLDPQTYVERFELESREIFNARQEILRACNIQPGMHIADVGAGTGFFTKLFAATTGDRGWVYAIDVAPRFIEHIRKELDAAGIENAGPVLSSQRVVNLAPHSVDLIFICDTYHHFEFPKSTLKSLHQAMRPGGTMVVIDFERIEGKSREWTMGHVRAGKEVFRQEIEDAGFEFVEEVKINAFAENYFLRFVKR